MAKRSKPGKQRTREHIIADLAFNHLERHVLRCGYTMHHVVQDYGLDAIIRTFSRDGLMESGAIWIQLKATDTVRRLQQTSVIGVRVQRRDLSSWLGEVYPVILVLYDGKRDSAYWLHVQALREEGRVFALVRQGASVTLHLKADQLVTEKTIRSWRELKNQSLSSW
jgi:hypothetical protein